MTSKRRNYFDNQKNRIVEPKSTGVRYFLSFTKDFGKASQVTDKKWNDYFYLAIPSCMKQELEYC